jgi:hypothetical protein
LRDEPELTMDVPLHPLQPQSAANRSRHNLREAKKLIEDRLSPIQIPGKTAQAPATKADGPAPGVLEVSDDISDGGRP